MVCFLQLLLTAEYLEMKRVESLSANTKIYFGNSIPSMFVDQPSGPAVKSVKRWEAFNTPYQTPAHTTTIWKFEI